MSNFSKFGLVLWLGFTGGGVAWAEDAQFTPQDSQPAEAKLAHPDLYIEDPYAPHDTTGNEARLGTVVGFVYGTPLDVIAIGASAAYGYRFGRFTLESEFDAYSLQSHGTIHTSLGPADGDFSVGHGERLSAMMRFDVVRLDSHTVGQNSMLALYVEGGAGVEWNSWSKPETNQPVRIVPDDTKRTVGQVGFGLSLDHRLQEPIGFPHRIAWLLGLRMAMSPHEPMVGSTCRGVTCAATITMDSEPNSIVDRSLLFQSSLQFTF
ncbi:MAG TPA: hypothetical protein VGC41_16490 [Kofleriaceae bacterium]